MTSAATPTIEAFRNASFTIFPTDRQPNNNDIIQLRKEMLSWMKKIPNLFNPQMGFASCMLTPAEYARVAPAGAPPHGRRQHPGPEPVIAPGAATAVREAGRSLHDKEIIAWGDEDQSHSVGMQKAIKVCHIYIDALRDNETDFDNVTLLQVFAHLNATYGAPTRKMLDENEKSMKDPWDAPNVPLENLWSCLQRGQKYAATSTRTISDGCLIDMALQVFEETQISCFTKSCFHLVPKTYS